LFVKNAGPFPHNLQSVKIEDDDDTLYIRHWYIV